MCSLIEFLFFLPAAMMLPNIQKVAKALIILPRLSFGWNSVKYENITGMLPPTLNKK